MSKLTLDNIGQVGSSQGLLNNNFGSIEEAIENTLSRDGLSPNEMNTDLDMNNHRVYNLPSPTSDAEPILKGEFDNLSEQVVDHEERIDIIEELSGVFLQSSTFLRTDSFLGFATTRVVLSTLNGAAVNTAILTEIRREGIFRWDSSNLSTEVAADVTQGLYVAPAASTGLATDGSQGAWVRQFSGAINIQWFGATGTGVEDYDSTYNLADTNAWVSFNAWSDLQTDAEAVELLIPPSPTGETYKFASTLARGGSRKLVVTGYGAKVRPPATYQTAVMPLSLTQPRIATVAAGSLTVTLLTLADASRFTVGQWACAVGVDIQASGYPQNSFFYEFRQVTAIDAGTGVITLDQKLKNTYKSTWPNYEPGSAFFPDELGPATLVPMVDIWDKELIYRGLTVTNTAEIYGAARKQLWEDCVFTSIALSPTIGKHIIYRRCEFPKTAIMEVDKLTELVEMDGCSVGHIRIQSSIDRMIIRCSDIRICEGLTKYAVIEDSVLDQLKIGVTGHGVNFKLSMKNAFVTDFNTNASAARRSPLSLMSYANGIFRFDATAISFNEFLLTLSFVPGAVCFLTTSGGGPNLGCPFRVSDVFRDGSDLCFQTDLPDTIPAPTFNGAAGDHFTVHPLPSVSVQESDGCLLLRSLSKAPKGLPLYSYWHTDLCSADITGQGHTFWGELDRVVGMRVKVHRAYTGAAGTLNLHPWGEFGANTLAGAYSGGANSRINPTFNLKIAGERHILPGTDTLLISTQAKVGATAGWAPGGGAVDTGTMATLPAEQTASTLVVPISVEPGRMITGFHLVGQIEAAGNTVIVDAALRKRTSASADVVDASIGAMTQLSVTADTIMSASNVRKAALTEIVAADETFYLLITATTGALCDIDLQGVVIETARHTGLKSGDVVPEIDRQWFVEGAGPYLSAVISAEATNLWPLWEIELQTDQLI